MAIKSESKQEYIHRRRRRVRELFRFEGLSPREITERLVSDGTIETTDETLASALRLVRSDVAAIRSETDDERTEDSRPSLASNDLDALERELADLRKERDRQQMIADGQPTEMCARSQYAIAACANPACMAEGKHIPYVGPAVGVTIVNTPQGPITSFKALWPAAVRQKASKDKAIMTRQISELERAITEKRAVGKPLGKDGGAVEGEGAIFRVVTRGMSLEELVAENASSPDGSKVN